MTRSARPAMTLAATLAAVLASVTLAAPVDAAYDPAPSTRWEPNGPVQVIASSGGRIYIGGAFTALTDPSGTGDTEPVGNVAALDASSGELIRSWDVSTNAPVTAIAVSADGSRVFLGGEFTSVNGTAAQRLVAVSGTDGAVIPSWRARANGRVHDLLVSAGRVYVAGGFHGLNGIADRFLGALDETTGARVPGFRAVADNPAHALATNGGRLYVSGRFTRVNATSRPQLAAVDAATGALTPFRPKRLCPTCETVWDVATDGVRVYAAGSGPGGRLVAVQPQTGAVLWRVPADGDVQAVAVSGGLVYAGGHFGQTLGGEERTQLGAVAADDGAVDPDFAPRLYRPSYPGVKSIVATPSGLFVGGHFGGAGAKGRSPYLARFTSR